ncbi:MAG: hypothetical protein PHH37_04660 [Paludibacter sp.]|nr:hypothetical protein [Paludibacter sp.]
MHPEKIFSVYRILSIILMIFIAANAIIAGVLFIIDPNGQMMGMSTDYLKYAPFRNYLIPGIILLIVNGLFNIWATIKTFNKSKYHPIYIMLQGVLLSGWIIVQMLMVRDVNILHAIMISIGIMLIFMGYRLNSK